MLFTIYTQQTSDHTRTVSSQQLEIDFVNDPSATLNVLNNVTWNEIKKYLKLQLKASTFVLSATILNYSLTELWILIFSQK